MSPRLLPLLVLLASLGGGRTVSAQDAPRLEVRVEGDCPDREAISRALGASIAVVQGEAPWRLTLTRATRSTRVELSEVGAAEPAQESLTRTITSDDCGAIAIAVGFIVQARFVQLELLPASVLAGEPPPADLPAPSVVAAAPTPPIPTSAPPPHAEPPSAPSAPPPSTDARRDRGDAAALRVAIGGGGALSFDPSALLAGLRLRVAYGPSTDGLELHVGALLWSTQTRGDGEGQVDLRAASFELGVDWRFDSGSWWIAPGIALALGATDATASNVEGAPSALGLEPTLIAGCGLGLPLTPQVGIRADAWIAAVLAGQRYRIEPLAEVARTASGLFALVLSAEVSILQ